MMDFAHVESSIHSRLGVRLKIDAARSAPSGFSHAEFVLALDQFKVSGITRERLTRRETRLEMGFANRFTLLESMAPASRENRVSASMSHSKEKGVIVWSQDPGVHGVGIDLEKSDRKVAPGVEARMAGTEEMAGVKIPSIIRWACKEAAYKAAPGYQNPDFHTYVIEVFDGTWARGTDHNLQRPFDILVHSFDDWFFAVAVYLEYDGRGG